MRNSTGPFAGCPTYELELSFETCQGDVALDPIYGCPNLEVAADQCRNVNDAPVGNWRVEAGCGKICFCFICLFQWSFSIGESSELDCDGGRVYSTTMTSDCLPTCYNLFSRACDTVGIEDGCTCPFGFAWDGAECQPMKPFCYDLYREGINAVNAAAVKCKDENDVSNEN